MNKEKIKEKVLTALKIRDAMRAIMKKHNVSTSYCNDMNPFYNQTDVDSEGFICEYYYGAPSRIYTPLGCMRIWSSFISGDKNCREAIAEIEETFGFVLKKESYNDYMGSHGGWYYITKLPWGGIKLKCDCLELDNTDDYISYDEAKELYTKVYKEYKQENV